MTDLTIPGLPAPAAWAVAPAAAHFEGGALTIVAPPLTDIFTDPKGSDPVASSPRLMFAASDPTFMLAAHVTVDFASTFDAGVLLLWADADHHAKLCFEYSPQGEPMIVSVVTNGVSDDCNSVALARTDIHLRAVRLGRAFAFHYSEDGTHWRLVRYFTLRNVEGLAAGFSSQSPTGQGCRAVFDSIRYAATVVEDIRSGA